MSNLSDSRKSPSSEPILASYVKAGAGSLRDIVFFTNATGEILQVQQITERHGTAEATAGTLTLTVKKAASGTAIASGTAVHAGTVNLKGTADTNASPTLSSTLTDYQLSPGDSLGADFSAAGTEIADVAISVILRAV